MTRDHEIVDSRSWKTVKQCNCNVKLSSPIHVLFSVILQAPYKLVNKILNSECTYLPMICLIVIAERYCVLFLTCLKCQTTFVITFLALGFYLRHFAINNMYITLLKLLFVHLSVASHARDRCCCSLLWPWQGNRGEIHIRQRAHRGPCDIQMHLLMDPFGFHGMKVAVSC